MGGGYWGTAKVGFLDKWRAKFSQDGVLGNSTGFNASGSVLAENPGGLKWSMQHHLMEVISF